MNQTSLQYSKQKNCSACGNNSTNHFLSWFNQTLSVLMHPIDMYVLTSPLGRFFYFLVEKASYPYVLLFRLVGIVGFNTDKTKAITERSRVIWEEAQKRNIRMKQLVILGKPVELYTAKINGKHIIFESIPRPMRSNADLWMDDKFILKRKLEAQQIPAPRGGSFYSWKKTKTFFETLKKPVIVKPRLGSRGRHTTTFIYTKEELKKAFRSAKKLCSFIIMEEHLRGSVYRGTVVGGICVGVLRGDPPQITGDGISTIEVLIDKKNNTKHEKVHRVEITPQLISFLKRQGYGLQTILETGIIVDLSEKIGTSYGGYSKEMLPETHPKIIEYIQKAGSLVDATVIGFDFIIEDIAKDPDQQHWGIIECNSLPFINLHHHPLEGTPINVAGFVWDLWK